VISLPSAGARDVDLKGNTLKVYTYLFKVERSGIREAQRNLGFKSPSLAQYHLDKLVEMGLATKDPQGGDYLLAAEVKIEALAYFLKLGSVLVPRFVLYSVMITVLFSYFVIAVSHFALSSLGIWAYIFGVIGLLITWYETIRAWRRSPF
jgi:DNA-binding transcriptional ArsR family regulator